MADDPKGQDGNIALHNDFANSDLYHTLTAEDFGFTDSADQTLSAVQITELPGAGTLTDNGVAVTGGQYIPIEDILSGLLVYTTSLNDQGGSSISFKVQDSNGTFANVANTLTTVPDAAPVIHVTGLINQDGYYTYMARNDTISDADDTHIQAFSVSITSGYFPGDTLNYNSDLAAAYNVTVTATDDGLSFSFDNQYDNNDIYVANALLQSITFAFIGTWGFGVFGPRQITVSATDPDLQVSAAAHIDINFPNYQPVGISGEAALSANGDADHVATAQTHTFFLNDFQYTDFNGEALYGVKITSLPDHGTLLLNGTAVALGETILAGDIDGGHLVFTADIANAAGTNFKFKVVDGIGGDSNTDTNDATMVIDARGAPVLATQGSGSNVYHADTPLALGSNYTLADTGDGNLSSLVISGGGAGAVWHVDTGSTNIIATQVGTTLTLSGEDTVANYQAVLQSLTYTSTSRVPGNALQNVTITATDTHGLQSHALSDTIVGETSIVVSATSATNGVPNTSPLGLGKVMNVTLDVSALLASGQKLSITGAPQLVLNDGGTATYSASLSDLAHGKLVFTTTVFAGQLNASTFVTATDLTFSGTAAIAIVDSANHPVSTITGADLPYQPNLGFMVDGVVPTITQATQSLPSMLHVGQTVPIEIDFSELVTLTGTPILKLSNGGTATFDHGENMGTYIRFFFNYTVAAGQDTSNLKITSFSNGVIKDYAGNVATQTVNNATLNIAVDTKAPLVTAVSATAAHASAPNTILPASTILNPGDVVTLTVKLGEAVNVTSTQQHPLTFKLNDGGIAAYVSGTGTSQLTFSYTVGHEATTALGVTTGALLDGSIADLAGNAFAGFTKATALGFKVDGVGPQVASVAIAPTTINSTTAPVTITLKMNEVATVSTTSGAAVLHLNNGGTATYSSGSGTNQLKFVYTPSSANADTASLLVISIDMNGTTWTDGYGNVTDGTNILALTGLPTTSTKAHISTADGWKGGTGNFTDNNWTAGTPDQTKGAVIASGTVNVSGADKTIASFSTAKAGTLTVANGNLSALDGTGGGANAGKLTVSSGTFTVGYLSAPDGPDLSQIVNDGINNTGSITLNADGKLSVIGNVTLNGTGTLTLAGGIIDAEYESVAAKFNNASTIIGNGTIYNQNQGSFAVVNGVKGSIAASGGDLIFKHLDSFENDGKMTTQGAATLAFANTITALTNIGSITAAAQGTVSFSADVANKGTISAAGASSAVSFGGKLTNSGTVSATGTGSSVSLSDGMTNSGTLAATGAGSTLTLTQIDNNLFDHTFTNTGTISATGNGSSITFDDIVFYNAGGKILVGANTAFNADIVFLHDGSLNIAAKGTLIVDAGERYFADVAVSNAGTFNIKSNAHLDFNNSENTTGGVTNTGTINVVGAIVTSSTINDTAPIITNKGTINLKSDGGGGSEQFYTIYAYANTTLQGGGNLVGADYAQRLFYISDEVTYINVDNTISASGTMLNEGTFVNGAKGTIIATGTNNSLQLSGNFVNNGKMIGAGAAGLELSSNGIVNNGTITTQGAGLVHVDNNVTLTNNGTIAAASGGNLQIDYGSNVNNSAAGKITVAAGGTLQMANSTINGGAVTVAAKGTVKFTSDNSDNAILSDVAFSNAGTVTLSNGVYLYIYDTTSTAAFTNTGVIDVSKGLLNFGQGSGKPSPTITNKGTIALQSLGNDAARLITWNDATLQGGGKITMTDAANNYINPRNGTALTNVDNTISGAGTILSYGSFINGAKGTIIATGTNNSLKLTGSNITNKGKMIGAGGAGLEFSSSITNYGTVTTQGAGLVTIHNEGDMTSYGVVSAVGTGAKIVINDTNILGTGTVSVAAGATLQMEGSSITADTITLAAKSVLNVFDGSNNAINTNTAGNSITFAGTININDGSNLSVASAGSFSNTGLINIQNGTFSETTGTVGGTVNIGTDSNYNVGSSTAKITFTGEASGHIYMENGFALGGTLNNFGGDNYIGFEDINGSSATGQIIGTQTTASTVLKISDLNGHAVNITFMGDYTHTTFTVADDGIGGTVLTLVGKAIAPVNNVYATTIGVDTITAADATSVISYAGATSAVNVDLSLQYLDSNHDKQAGGAFSHGDVLTGFQNVIGSNYADTLKGDAAHNNTFAGGGGADMIDALDGHTGHDTFIFSVITESTLTAYDTIRNFIDDQDLIQFSSKLFPTFTFEASGTLHSGTKGDIITTYDAGADKTFIKVDVNGDGKIDSHDIVIALTGQHTLGHDDFIIV